jgi:hypothetical protein
VGQELVNAGRGVTIGEACERRGQPCVRVDACELDTRKNPRFEGCPVIHSAHWAESFDAPTQPVFAGGAP